MDLGIAGRRAVVCASSAGLGRACATELARAGAIVILNGRRADALEATIPESEAEEDEVSFAELEIPVENERPGGDPAANEAPPAGRDGVTEPTDD